MERYIAENQARNLKIDVTQVVREFRENQRKDWIPAYRPMRFAEAKELRE